MHNDIEIATWDDAIATNSSVSRLGAINGTKTEIEAIFGVVVKHDHGVYQQDNLHYYEYQIECKFKNDGQYFSVFTEMVQEDDLDSQILWIVDGCKQCVGLIDRIEALL